MPDEIKQGQDWIEEAIRQSSSVDVEIQWAEDDDRGPPDASGLSKLKSFYRVVVVTPEGSRATERIPASDIEDCAHDQNAEVRQRVGQKILGMLRRIGIAMYLPDGDQAGVPSRIPRPLPFHRFSLIKRKLHQQFPSFPHAIGLGRMTS